MKEKQIYVLEEGGLRTKIIRLYYDTPVEGYRERQKIAELVKRNYWWSGITKEVERYMEEYNIC